jgi:hypothetical protein
MVGEHLWMIAPGVLYEAQSIKSRQTELGSDPEITVFGPEKAKHPVIRQTALFVPIAQAVLALPFVIAPFDRGNWRENKNHRDQQSFDVTAPYPREEAPVKRCPTRTKR